MLHNLQGPFPAIYLKNYKGIIKRVIVLIFFTDAPDKMTGIKFKRHPKLIVPIA